MGEFYSQYCTDRKSPNGVHPKQAKLDLAVAIKEETGFNTDQVEAIIGEAEVVEWLEDHKMIELAIDLARLVKKVQNLQ